MPFFKQSLPLMKLEFYSFWISITHLNNFYLPWTVVIHLEYTSINGKKLIEVVYITQKVRIIAYYMISFPMM